MKILKNNKTVKTKLYRKIDRHMMLHSNCVGNQVLIKKNILIGAGLFDEKLKRYQDYDMWLRVILKYGDALMIPNVTQKIHYEHDVSSNNTIQKNFEGAFVFYKKHKINMSSSQRKFQLYLIYKIQKKKITFVNMLRIITVKNFVQMLLFYFGLKK